MEQVKTPENFGRKPLEYYQKKIMNQKKGEMWCKDVRINYSTDGDDVFDDFFKISNQKYRIYKFTVVKLKKNGYICGLKFFYQHIEDSSNVVEGFSMGPPSMLKRKDVQIETFELKTNEYIIEFFGKKGMIINDFGVKTNQGNTYSCDFKAGDDYSLKAPNGFYFSCIGAYYSHGYKSISSFTAEVKELPQNDVENQRRRHSYQIKSYKPAFRKLIDFLTTSEVTKLFRINKDFARFRHDDYVLTNIGCRCIYSGIPKQIQYIKKMIKYSPKDEINQTYERIYSYLNLCQNFISNPDGVQNFDGYQITQNGGNGIQVQKNNDKEYNFITSFSWSTLLWSRKLKEIFSDANKFDYEAIVQKIQTAQYAIVASAQISDTGYGGEASLRFEIKDTNDQIIYEQERPCKDLTRDYKLYSIKYIHDKPEITPNSINFYISGKDTCFWEGHYGAKFKTITCKVIPIEVEQEKQLFEKFVK